MYDDPTVYSSFDYSTVSGLGDASALASVMAIFGVIMIPLLIIGLALYIYSSLALMKIAQRTNTPNAWLAWIPIANLYLMTQIAQVPWWTFLFVFLVFIPILNFIAGLALLGLQIWWWMKIAERRNRPSWWGVLIALIPLVNLILMGIMAWGKDEKPAK